MTAYTSKVRTCFWFNGRGREAAEYWTSLLPDSEIEAELHKKPDGDPMVIEFRLAGVPYMILDAGSEFPPTPAASISVLTEDQAETDRLWEALLEGGGQTMMCGWLSDRFGVAWQIVPKAFPLRLNDPDREAAGRAQAAMMKMVKLDIAAMEAAFRG